MTQKIFTPGPEHATDLRAALGQFATGVCIVTAQTPTGPIGMTVNSFTSVSMDPPLLLWCPAKVSARHDAFAAATHSALHVLRADQGELAMQFARSGHEFPKDVPEGAADVPPHLDDVLARFECRPYKQVDAGDHSILIQEITKVIVQPGAPLLFHGGRFLS